jgi:hypothetical protein
MEPLNVLNNLQIASLCPASWKGMKGDDRIRFCESCSKHVYNISDLTADESLRIIHENEDTACLRLYRRRDGTILTADCPVGLRYRLRRKLLRTLSAVVLLSVAVPSTVLAYVKGSRPGTIPPMPTGPGVTFADWSDWTLTVVGLRRRQSMTVGEISCPTVPVRLVPRRQNLVNPPATPQEIDDL